MLVPQQALLLDVGQQVAVADDGDRGIDVSLPVANLPDKQPEDRITVTVTADGRIMVGDRPVNIALLEDQIRGLMAGRTSHVVYLRADESLRYGKVIEVMDKLKQGGVEQVGFAYVLPKEKR